MAKNITSSSSSTQNLETGTKRTRDSTLDEINSNSTLKYKKEILSLMFNQGQLSNDPKSSNKKRSNGKSSPNRGDNKDSLRERRKEMFPKRLPKSQHSFTSVAYICKGPDYKGKFDPLAAKALGLEPGPQYDIWMNKFGPETEHIIANEKYCPQRIIFYSSALSQLKMSKIDEQHFRIPYYSNEPIKQLESLDNIPKKASFAVPMMIYQTEPSFKLDMSQLGPVFDHNIESGKLLESSDDYLNIAEEVKQEVARSHSEAKNIPGKDVIITTLGTGSTFPSKYRNVSATLIKIPNNGFILLDVGEGTLGSMSRHFGPYDQPHDHHLGIVRVLKKWNEIHKGVDDATISVFGPSRLQKWLDEYSDVEDIGCSKPKNSMGINKVETVAVIHCPNSFGISIEHSDGWKIVYSGDTRPCEDLVRVVKGIQKYQYLPRVGISFDLIQVSIDELYKLPKFVKALKVLYADENEAGIEEDDNVYEEVYIEDEEDDNENK
ncbi:hypothetical protein RhiirA1_454275 [Rhizophagus irregularis]|uniref:ribonuclease Z n=1 Tax=Rhizophagus irregularis TaxID=588596 RepID=A0A2N0S5H6_9GLOM|nr:hypothetical protein RhiirA1_454275 [Rhizophagus irregularis]